MPGYGRNFALGTVMLVVRRVDRYSGSASGNAETPRTSLLFDLVSQSATAVAVCGTCWPLDHLVIPEVVHCAAYSAGSPPAYRGRTVIVSWIVSHVKGLVVLFLCSRTATTAPCLRSFTAWMI